MPCTFTTEEHWIAANIRVSTTPKITNLVD
jgi:hypothetical protein